MKYIRLLVVVFGMYAGQVMAFSMPSFSMPTFTMPSFSLPSFSVPAPAAEPEVPTVAAPEPVVPVASEPAPLAAPLIEEQPSSLSIAPPAAVAKEEDLPHVAFSELQHKFGIFEWNYYRRNAGQARDAIKCVRRAAGDSFNNGEPVESLSELRTAVNNTEGASDAIARMYLKIENYLHAADNGTTKAGIDCYALADLDQQVSQNQALRQTALDKFAGAPADWKTQATIDVSTCNAECKNKQQAFTAAYADWTTKHQQIIDNPLSRCANQNSASAFESCRTQQLTFMNETLPPILRGVDELKQKVAETYRDASEAYAAARDKYVLTGDDGKGLELLQASSDASKASLTTTMTATLAQLKSLQDRNTTDPTAVQQALQCTRYAESNYHPFNQDHEIKVLVDQVYPLVEQSNVADTDVAGLTTQWQQLSDQAEPYQYALLHQKAKASDRPCYRVFADKTDQDRVTPFENAVKVIGEADPAWTESLAATCDETCAVMLQSFKGAHADWQTQHDALAEHSVTRCGNENDVEAVKACQDKQDKDYQAFKSWWAEEKPGLRSDVENAHREFTTVYQRWQVAQAQVIPEPQPTPSAVVMIADGDDAETTESTPVPSGPAAGTQFVLSEAGGAVSVDQYPAAVEKAGLKQRVEGNVYRYNQINAGDRARMTCAFYDLQGDQPTDAKFDPEVLLKSWRDRISTLVTQSNNAATSGQIDAAAAAWDGLQGEMNPYDWAVKKGWGLHTDQQCTDVIRNAQNTIQRAKLDELAHDDSKAVWDAHAESVPPAACSDCAEKHVAFKTHYTNFQAKYTEVADLPSERFHELSTLATQALGLKADVTDAYTASTAAHERWQTAETERLAREQALQVEDQALIDAIQAQNDALKALNKNGSDQLPGHWTYADANWRCYGQYCQDKANEFRAAYKDFAAAHTALHQQAYQACLTTDAGGRESCYSRYQELLQQYDVAALNKKYGIFHFSYYGTNGVTQRNAALKIDSYFALDAAERHSWQVVFTESDCADNAACLAVKQTFNTAYQPNGIVLHDLPNCASKASDVDKFKCYEDNEVTFAAIDLAAVKAAYSDLKAQLDGVQAAHASAAEAAEIQAISATDAERQQAQQAALAKWQADNTSHEANWQGHQMPDSRVCDADCQAKHASFSEAYHKWVGLDDEIIAARIQACADKKTAEERRSCQDEQSSAYAVMHKESDIAGFSQRVKHAFDAYVEEVDTQPIIAPEVEAARSKMAAAPIKWAAEAGKDVSECDSCTTAHGNFITLYEQWGASKRQLDAVSPCQQPDSAAKQTCLDELMPEIDSLQADVEAAYLASIEAYTAWEAAKEEPVVAPPVAPEVHELRSMVATVPAVEWQDHVDQAACGESEDCQLKHAVFKDAHTSWTETANTVTQTEPCSDVAEPEKVACYEATKAELDTKKAAVEMAYADSHAALTAPAAPRSLAGAVPAETATEAKPAEVAPPLPPIRRFDVHQCASDNGQWCGFVEPAFNFQSGNSQVKSLVVDGGMSKRREKWEYGVVATINYVETDGVTSDDTYWVGFKLKYHLGDAYSLFNEASFESARQQGYKQILTNVAGVEYGYKFNDKVNMLFGLGLGGRQSETNAGLERTDFLKEFRVQFNWQITERVLLNELAAVDFGGDLVTWTSDTKLNTQLSDALALVYNLGLTHYSEVPADTRKLNMNFKVGLRYDFEM